MKKPNILIFFSDQHHAEYAGFSGHNIVKTPNLDQLAQDGTVFDAAYTSCPLCVPARSSLLTGQLPSATGIFTNSGAIGEDHATFVHSIAAEGYETVLCGRMHFMGEDQMHGFTKRIMGEITPTIWGRGGKDRADLGPYVQTLQESRCLEVVGGGTSPVLEYDRAVIRAALEYLSHDHEKPQCIVVGIYAPHFTYVAPPDLYQYYKEIIQIPDYMKQELNYSHPVFWHRQREVDDETWLKARAAYFGMITNLDQQVGVVREAWNKYLDRNEREGIFIYISDHGDQAGEHGMNAKQTFFEGSARIPMIFEGKGIKANQRIEGPVSIMDVGPTLCDLIGAIAPPKQDGESLAKQLTSAEEDHERYVLSENIESKQGSTIPGRMIRQGKWKLISYAFHDEHDLLFNLESDPHELKNVIKEYPEKAKNLKQLLNNNWDVEGIISSCKYKAEHHKLLSAWGRAADVEESERWDIPEIARELPIII